MGLGYPRTVCRPAQTFDNGLRDMLFEEAPSVANGRIFCARVLWKGQPGLYLLLKATTTCPARGQPHRVPPRLRGVENRGCARTDRPKLPPMQINRRPTRTDFELPSQFLPLQAGQQGNCARPPDEVWEVLTLTGKDDSTTPASVLDLIAGYRPPTPTTGCAGPPPRPWPSLSPTSARPRPPWRLRRCAPCANTAEQTRKVLGQAEG
jgi:hypothetical protein